MLERPDVRVVPLTFHFREDETHGQGDMTNNRFYESAARLRRPSYDGATLPGPSSSLRGALRLRRHPGSTLSSKFSGTYDSALQAAGMVDRPVQVLDAKSAEMGSGLILLEALRCIDEGGDFDEVRHVAERAIGGRGCSLPSARWSIWPRVGA